jgi:uncharacterized membrane protein YdjX (TVP38/TMEM64 family)
MRGFWRPLILIVLALLVPIVPFLALGQALDERVGAWLDPPPAPSTIALVTVGVLAIDVFLPVPSSVVSTFAGSQLGVVAATGASWLGMTAGAVFAFWLARCYGRPLAVRLSSVEEIEQMDTIGTRLGAWTLIVTRPLPILAEAAVLLLGTTSLPWRQFLPPVLLSNLGIAIMYSILGQIARTQGELPLALAASIALPVLATTMARWLLGKQTSEPARPTTDPPPPS